LFNPPLMVSSELDAIYKSSQTDGQLKSSNKFVVAMLLPPVRGLRRSVDGVGDAPGRDAA